MAVLGDVCHTSRRGRLPSHEGFLSCERPRCREMVCLAAIRSLSFPFSVEWSPNFTHPPNMATERGSLQKEAGRVYELIDIDATLQDGFIDAMGWITLCFWTADIVPQQVESGAGPFCGTRKQRSTFGDPDYKWLVKTNGIPFGVGEFTTHFRTYSSGDWDVHWGAIWILTHGQVATRGRLEGQKGWLTTEFESHQAR